MVVHVPAQRSAVHADRRRCTWMYETRNETDQPPSGSTVARGLAEWNHVLVAHRRLRDPQFRQEQEDGLRAPHVAPINDLVDGLIEPPPPDGRGWIPYVAPVYGGVNARVLCIQRDPPYRVASVGNRPGAAGAALVYSRPAVAWLPAAGGRSHVG
jgi:hypothetical protein